MYIKSVLIIAIFATTVKCDCESELLKCLSDFVINMFGSNATEVKSDVFDDNGTKSDFVYFDLKNDFINDTENLFNNISLVIKDDVENKGLFESALNLTKFIDETTKVFLNIFDLKNVQNLFSPEEKEIICSEIESVVNNKNLTMQSIEELFEEVNRDIAVKVNTTKTKIDNEIDEIFNEFAKQFNLNDTYQNNNTEKDMKIVKHVEKPEISFRNSIDLALRTQLNEISDSSFDNNYYDATEDNSTDYPIIDYVELYKDTTNEDVVVTTDLIEVITESSVFTEDSIEVSCHGNASSVRALVHTWIAAIFVKNASTEQFDYVCDGAILTDRIILTAARCLLSGNNTLEVSNVLVISGKTTLLNTGSNERVYRIQNVKLHDNFTNQGEVQNDIATLKTDENISFNNDVQTACLISKDMDTESVVDAVTTGWKISGELTTVHFDAKTYGDCKNLKNASKNQFCATYGNEITTCPSYGGLNIVKLSNDEWFLNGIRSGDTTDRTLCLEKTLVYTDLKKYIDWIDV